MIKGMNRLLGTHLDRHVFYGSVLLIVPFILLGAFSPELLAQASNAALSWVTSWFGWLFLSSVNIFLVVSLLIAFSPFGSVKLGKKDDKPDFSRLSWFSMLFSAGMGIGLVFWSIAEPLYHFTGPPTGEAETKEAARLAISIFFHHWGMHAWATYVAVGLPLAYFQYRHSRPCTVSRCLVSSGSWSGGESSYSPAMSWCFKVVDILAVWATVMGVVTSLGLGAMQIASGLSINYGLPNNAAVTGIVIVVITLLFVVSALSGINKGIRQLSLLNVVLMVLLLLFFLAAGPFSYLMGTFTLGFKDYLVQLIPLSTTLSLFDNSSWTGSWTIFYWAWWVAWAPFVGAFIASISKGRTVREFILVVLCLPPLFSFIFASALGGTALQLQLFENVPLALTVSKSIEAALFQTLHQLPAAGFTILIANILIASFFITSADSATLVLTKFTTGGKGPVGNHDRKGLIIFWGLVLSGLSIVLVFSGGVKALQTASIVGALPFLCIMFFLLYAVVSELTKEFRISKTNNQTKLTE